MPSLCWDARPEERINYTLSVLVLLKKAKAFYLIEISKPSNSTEQNKNLPIQRLSIARVNAQRFIHCHEKEKLVELSGIEPLTSSLRTTRSPN